MRVALPALGPVLTYDGTVDIEETARMIVALWLLGIQGVIGAFDTALLPRVAGPAAGAREAAASELKLHAARDFFYAVLFAHASLAGVARGVGGSCSSAYSWRRSSSR